MPRSGYDSVKYTSFGGNQGTNRRRCRSSAAESNAAAEATRVPRSCAIPDTDGIDPSSTLRAPTIQNSSMAPPPSYTPPALGPCRIPFQQHSPNVQTSASPARNFVPTSATPMPVLRPESMALPTVRVSPGYVEHTGSYRVFNSTTGRGWRYSEPVTRAESSASPGEQQHQPGTITTVRQRRPKRQRNEQLRPRSNTSNRRISKSQMVDRRGEGANSISLRPLGIGPGIAPPESSASDSRYSEGRFNNDENLTNSHALGSSGVIDTIGPAHLKDIRKGKEPSRRKRD
ncbi:hypothetical protein F5Y08DRAFT_342228 [Xylaria arbuscula]|nr:hypothetical protein F5Y08DRAFT_342228 [Xylaria arbuscula]